MPKKKTHRPINFWADPGEDTPPVKAKRIPADAPWQAIYTEITISAPPPVPGGPKPAIWWEIVRRAVEMTQAGL